MASGCADEMASDPRRSSARPHRRPRRPLRGSSASARGRDLRRDLRYVGDGDSLCLGPSADPATWIGVRLSDFDAPELHSLTGRVDPDRVSGLVHGRVLGGVDKEDSQIA